MRNNRSNAPFAPASMVPVGDPPPEVREALSHLIGFLLDEGTGTMHFNLDEVHADGRPVGRFEVVVQRL